MKEDEYLCKECKNRWVEKKSNAPFCHACYSKEIINLTENERIKKRKKAEEDAARKRREEMIQREKEYRTRILKNRDTAKKYYRGKNK